MRHMVRGAIRRGTGLALSLAVLGCSKPLATFDVTEPAAGRPALQRSEAESSASRSGRVVAIARAHLGAPYAWGGSSPDGFDCSGFVLYVYSHVGVALPHNAARQFRYGAPITRERHQPDDVIFFDGLHHAGIYVGDGRFIHARRSGHGVIVSGLDESWYRTRWVGGRRF